MAVPFIPRCIRTGPVALVEELEDPRGFAVIGAIVQSAMEGIDQTYRNCSQRVIVGLEAYFSGRNRVRTIPVLLCTGAALGIGVAALVMRL